MVLLAAAVCTRSGKALISRQFIEMSRARIEGLLSAFPKLMNSDSKGTKQHTFVETDSVRYVYQPLEKMYMLLITTKNSNILEDLETLRLFSRVIPEYCRTIDENEVSSHAFELIFAFDEIVALGYRESVNLAQIRTFTDMDSHEEKVAIAIRETQEAEAIKQRKIQMKEIARRKKEEGGKRLGGISLNAIGGGIGGGGISSTPTATPTAEPIETKPKNPRRIAKGGGMQLKGKKTGLDNFVDQLENEGVHVSSTGTKKEVTKTQTPASLTESIHIRVEEKIQLQANRDGGLDEFILTGMMLLKISDEETAKIRVKLDRSDDRVMWQTHPQVDKKQFANNNLIGLKNADKPFPINQDVGVLKWRLTTQDEDQMPLNITCWPNENGDGGCDVSVEYELQAGHEHLELADVSIKIPVPSGVGAPVIGSCDGDYNHDQRKNVLEWNLPIIDSSNKDGSLEFSVHGIPDDFFPVKVEFHSTKKSYVHMSILTVSDAETGDASKYSSENAILVDKYEIV